MFRHESYLTENSLLSLQSELKNLTQKYSAYINQESLQGEVGCLTHWVDSYRNGDEAAGYYLTNYGSILLEKVRNKLQTAATEVQRWDNESPISKNFSGGKSDRLSKAAQSLSKAEEQLNKALAE